MSGAAPLDRRSEPDGRMPADWLPAGVEPRDPGDADAPAPPNGDHGGRAAALAPEVSGWLWGSSADAIEATSAPPPPLTLASTLLRARTHREATRRRPREVARKAPASNGSRAANGLDLNSATFDSLRGLGLSVNQAARFIAQREEQGGFGSLDELDGLFGLPREVVAELKQLGRV